MASLERFLGIQPSVKSRSILEMLLKLKACECLRRHPELLRSPVSSLLRSMFLALPTSAHFAKYMDI